MTARTPPPEHDLAYSCYAVPAGFSEPFKLPGGFFRVSSITEPTVHRQDGNSWTLIPLKDNRFSVSASTIRLGFRHEAHPNHAVYIYKEG